MQKNNRMIYQIDETRDKILEIAEDMFIDKGLYETKMKDLAVAIGISRTSLYRYYRDKLDLSLAIVRLRMNEINDNERVEKQTASLSDGLSKVETLLRTRWLSPELKDTYRFLAEFDAYYSGSRIPDGFREKMEEVLNENRVDHLLISYLQEGQKDGTIRKDQELMMMEKVLINGVRSLHHRLILRGAILVEMDLADLDFMMDEYLKILMSGIESS